MFNNNIFFNFMTHMLSRRLLTHSNSLLITFTVMKIFMRKRIKRNFKDLKNSFLGAFVRISRDFFREKKNVYTIFVILYDEKQQTFLQLDLTERLKFLHPQRKLHEGAIFYGNRNSHFPLFFFM